MCENLEIEKFQSPKSLAEFMFFVDFDLLTFVTQGRSNQTLQQI